MEPILNTRVLFVGSITFMLMLFYACVDNKLNNQINDIDFRHENKLIHESQQNMEMLGQAHSKIIDVYHQILNVINSKKEDIDVISELIIGMNINSTNVSDTTALNESNVFINGLDNKIYISESLYLKKLLFNYPSNTILTKTFLTAPNDIETYIPMRMDYYRRSRVIYGDVSSLRQLIIDNILIKSQCMNGMLIGGSVTKRFSGYFRTWFNQYFPCNGSHYINMQSHGGYSSCEHRRHLATYFGELNWYNKKSKYDFIIMETASNGGWLKYENTQKCSEITIRHLLQLDKVPVILYVQTHQIHTAFMNPKMDAPNEFIQGDYAETVLLRHYQIPTVSIGSIIYPLAYRFHQIMGNDYEEYKFKPVNISSDVENYHMEYNDSRYSNNEGRLRSDAIHPPMSGGKYICSLISYLFVSEYNLIQHDLNTFNMSLDDLRFKNKLWISNTEQSLPPPLYIQRNISVTDNKYFVPIFQLILDLWAGEFLDELGLSADQMSYPISSLHPNMNYTQNHISYQLRLFDPNMFPQNGYHKVITENNGFYFISEHKKFGLICNQLYGFLSIKLSYHSWILHDTTNFVSITPALFTLLYLTSYENMGSAFVWIDSKKEIQKPINITQEGKDSLYHNYIDGLINDKISVAHALNFDMEPFSNIDLRKSDLYFHIIIIPCVPAREHNKFKLLSLTLYV